MKWHALIAGGALAATALAPAAEAQGKLGLGGRYAYVRNIDSENDVNMGGVLVRLKQTTFGFEGAVDYRNENLGGGFDLKSWPVTASLLVFPVPGLYGLAGLGWYNSTVEPPEPFDDELDDTDTQLGYHVGAGLEIPVSERLNFIGDVRYLFVDHDFRDLPDEVGQVEPNYLSVNLGGVVYFR